MRTFKLELGIDIRCVVPEAFTKDMRQLAYAAVDAGADGDEFLRNAQEQFPQDDDAFTLHILKHGIRRKVRADLAAFLTSEGIGCRLAPVAAHAYVPMDVENKLADKLVQQQYQQ